MLEKLTGRREYVIHLEHIILFLIAKENCTLHTTRLTCHSVIAGECHSTISMRVLHAEHREECTRLCKKRVGVESSWSSLQPDTECP